MGEMGLDFGTNHEAAKVGVRRRTIVKGAAWSIPIIATTVGLPGAAASVQCGNPFLYQVNWSNFTRTSFSASAATGTVLATPLNGGPAVVLSLSAVATGPNSSLQQFFGGPSTFSTNSTHGEGIPGTGSTRLVLAQETRGGSGQSTTILFSSPVRDLAFGISNIDGISANDVGYQDNVSITPGFETTDTISSPVWGGQILGGTGIESDPWRGGGGNTTSGTGYVAVQYLSAVSAVTIDYTNGLPPTFYVGGHMVEISTMTFSVCP